MSNYSFTSKEPKDELALYLKSAKSSLSNKLRTPAHAPYLDHSYTNNWQKKYDSKSDTRNVPTVATVTSNRVKSGKENTELKNTKHDHTQISLDHTQISLDHAHKSLDPTHYSKERNVAASDSWMFSSSTTNTGSSNSNSEEEEHLMLRNIRSIVELDSSEVTPPTSSASSPKKTTTILTKDAKNKVIDSISNSEDDMSLSSSIITELDKGHMTRVLSLGDLDVSDEEIEIKKSESIISNTESINSNVESINSNTESINSNDGVSPINPYIREPINSNTDSINSNNTEVTSQDEYSEDFEEEIEEEYSIIEEQLEGEEIEKEEEIREEREEEKVYVKNEDTNISDITHKSLPRQPDRFDIATQTEDLTTTEGGIPVDDTPLLLETPILLESSDQHYLKTTSLLPHIIRSDALEALTVYSPALLALNNLTLSQVSLTRQLIEQTRSLSHSIVSPPDHHYVTLDETREYMRQHRPKVLSSKEALHLVTKRRQGNSNNEHCQRSNK